MTKAMRGRVEEKFQKIRVTVSINKNSVLQPYTHIEHNIMLSLNNGWGTLLFRSLLLSYNLLTEALQHHLKTYKLLENQSVKFFFIVFYISIVTLKEVAFHFKSVWGVIDPKNQISYECFTCRYWLRRSIEGEKLVPFLSTQMDA